MWPEWTIIDNFPFKSSPNILVKFWAILKTSFFNRCGYFFATFGNLLASFIPTSGHTDSNDRSSKINADGIEHKSLIPKNFSNQLLKNLLDLLNQNKKTQIQTNNKKIMVENLFVDLSFPIPNGTIELSNNVCNFVLNLFIKSR